MEAASTVEVARCGPLKKRRVASSHLVWRSLVAILVINIRKMRGMLKKAFKNARHSERLATSLQHRSLRRRTVTAMAPNASITDKQIVVVGANRGIGYEFAKQFLEKGNRVVATARDLSKASSLIKLKEQHAGLELTELDVTSADSRKEWAQALRKKFNAVDYLINNAGVASWGGLGQLTEEELLHCIRTNTLGPLLVTQEILRANLLKNGSVVANLTSKMGSLTDNTSGGTYAYRASKAALNAVTKSLALDLQDRGITTVLLHPGWVKTDMTRHSGLIDAQTSVAGMISVFEGSKPLVGRWYDYKHEEIPW